MKQSDFSLLSVVMETRRPPSGGLSNLSKIDETLLVVLARLRASAFPGFLAAFFFMSAAA